MYGYRRARVDLDADTHECFRYFSLLRGVPVGGAMRQVLSREAVTIEKEFPPIRAHMLAWRAAMAAARSVDGNAVAACDTGSPELEEIPF